MEPTLESVRIRLEGALEVIEQATARYLVALDWLGDDWCKSTRLNQSRLIELAQHETEVSAASDKVQAMSNASQWPAAFGGARALAAYQDARQRLLARLQEIQTQCGAPAEPMLASSIQSVLALAEPQGEAPLFYVSATRFTWHAFVLALASMATLVAGIVVSFPIWPLSAIAGALAGLSVLLPRIDKTTLELFPGRLVFKQGGQERPHLLPSRDLALDDHGVLEVRGLGRLRLGVDDGAHLATMLKLLGTVDWPKPVKPPDDHLVVPAIWRPTRTWGALLYCEGEAWFLHGGSRVFDVAARVSKEWPRPRAALLAWALLRLPREVRAELVRRLQDAQCLVALGPYPKVRTWPWAARFGPDVEVPFVNPVRREIDDWEARVAKLNVERSSKRLRR